MGDLIVVHPDFDGVWPFAADHFRSLWPEADFVRLAHGEERLLGEVGRGPEPRDAVGYARGASKPDVSASFLRTLQEATFQGSYGRRLGEGCSEYLAEAGVAVYDHPSEGFWSQTVAEFGLALTLCGLRRIPQLHREIIQSQAPWGLRAARRSGSARSEGTPVWR